LFGGSVGVELHAPPPQQRPQLAGGQLAGALGDLGDQVAGRPQWEVGGAVDQDTRPAKIDLAAFEQLAHLWQSLGQVESQGNLVVGGHTGEVEGGADLERGELLVLGAGRQRGDVPRPLALEVRDQPIPGD
jgi:hypothetical protein